MKCLSLPTVAVPRQGLTARGNGSRLEKVEERRRKAREWCMDKEGLMAVGRIMVVKITYYYIKINFELVEFNFLLLITGF